MNPPLNAGLAGGTLVFPVGSGTDEALSLLQQADGRLVLVGHSMVAGKQDFSVVRLNLDGTRDTGFDLDGRAFVDVGGLDDWAYGVVQQADGKLVLGGWSRNAAGALDFGLARLNSDGSLDSGFGGDGTVQIDVGGNNDVAYSLIRQADGKLVLSGWSHTGVQSNFSAIRLNADGSLDTGFGANGKVQIPVTAESNQSKSVVQQPDGKLVLGGYSTNAGLCLTRLNADGSLDTGFGNGGTAIVDATAGYDYGNSLIVQSDGKLVLGGYTRQGGVYDYLLIRLNPDGSLDTSFDGDGKLQIDVGGSNDYGYSLIQQADGKLVLAGTSAGLEDYDYSVIRLNSNGSLDNGFGTGGKAVISVAPGADTAYALIQQADGKLVLAGASRSSTGDDYDFSLIRLNTDGSLDTGLTQNAPLVGTADADTLTGGAGDDTVLGLASDDRLTGNAGNDQLDGGGGVDSAHFNGAANHYHLTFAGDQIVLHDYAGNDGTDTLTRVETLQFADKSVIVESGAHGSYADLPVELYHFFIVAFNAAPGVEYMDQLAEAYRYGLSVKQIVDIFTTKHQFTDVYPTSLSHTALGLELANQIIKNSATAEAKAQAASDIRDALDIGWTVGDVIYTVFGNLANKPLSDPTWGNTARQFANEIAVAKVYTEMLNQNTTDLQTLRDVLAPVDAFTDVSTVAAITQLIGDALLAG
jgi:uncharacterized delta-60 repeat protein